jgi:hypothetical protein
MSKVTYAAVRRPVRPTQAAGCDGVDVMTTRSADGTIEALGASP